MDLVITGSADGTAKVWSLYSGECIHVSLFFKKSCIPTYTWGPSDLKVN